MATKKKTVDVAAEVNGTVKTEETPVKENTKNIKKEDKTPKALKIEDVEKLIELAGIKIYNPQAKGAYRIMGTKKGSSINVQKKGYIIYTTDDDFKLMQDAKMKGVELTENGNSQDKSRPNVVRITDINALEDVLVVYSKNPVNRPVIEEQAPAEVAA